MTPIQIRAVAIALSIAFGSVGGTGTTHRSAKDQNASVTISSSMMADGREWTTANLNVSVSPSYCYDDAEPNCRRYGRLYTWESAQRVCQSLGNGWRLPTDDEWRQAREIQSHGDAFGCEVRITAAQSPGGDWSRDGLWSPHGVYGELSNECDVYGPGRRMR